MVVAAPSEGGERRGQPPRGRRGASPHHPGTAGFRRGGPTHTPPGYCGGPAPGGPPGPPRPGRAVERYFGEIAVPGPGRAGGAGGAQAGGPAPTLHNGHGPQHTPHPRPPPAFDIKMRPNGAAGARRRRQRRAGGREKSGRRGAGKAAAAGEGRRAAKRGRRRTEGARRRGGRGRERRGAAMERAAERRRERRLQRRGVDGGRSEEAGFAPHPVPARTPRLPLLQKLRHCGLVLEPAARCLPPSRTAVSRRHLGGRRHLSFPPPEPGSSRGGSSADPAIFSGSRHTCPGDEHGGAHHTHQNMASLQNKTVPRRTGQPPAGPGARGGRGPARTYPRPTW